jgi:hypothetical protein
MDAIGASTVAASFGIVLSVLFTAAQQDCKRSGAALAENACLLVVTQVPVFHGCWVVKITFMLGTPRCSTAS